MKIRVFSKSILLMLLILALLALQTLLGQSTISLIGYIFDKETGEPLVGAVVQILNTTYTTSSGQEGFFDFENLPPGYYDLQITSLGYQSVTLRNIYNVADQPQKIRVSLLPDPIPLDSVQVTTDPLNFRISEDGATVVITAEEIKLYENLGVGQLLQRVAGVEIQSSRGGMTVTKIRIHGGSSNQVLILLDNQRLNNPQTGEVDLNLISLKNIQEIEVIRQGNSALYGGNAFDGIIHFRTKKFQRARSAEIKSHLGSFSSAGGEISLNSASDILELQMSYFQNYSTQNFTYQHERETFTRENAWYRNQNFYSKLAYNRYRNDLSLFYNYHSGKQGLPSAYYEEMNPLQASLTENLSTIQFNHRLQFNSRFYIQSLIGYHLIRQLYDNSDDPSPFTRYLVEQENLNRELKIELFQQIEPVLEIMTGFNYLNEKLDNHNLLYPDYSMGIKSRNLLAGYGSMAWSFPFLKNIFDSIILEVAGRVEKVFDHNLEFFPLLGVSFVPKTFTQYHFSANWGEALRYPDFNSLFWKGDVRAQGNPALLPERKKYWNTSLRYMPDNYFIPQILIYFYNEQIRDLIFWHRGAQGLWEPRNEARATKRGFDLQIDKSFLRERIKLQIAYSYVEPINKTDEPTRKDKTIVYIPRNTLMSSFWFHTMPLQFMFSYRYVSERQITAANTGYPLSAYHLVDGLISYNRKIFNLKLNCELAVKNITASSYELIRGYPMPARDIQFSLGLQYPWN